MALYKGSIEIAGAGFGGNSSSIVGGSGGVIDGERYIINPNGTGDDKYVVTTTETLSDNNPTLLYIVQNDCGLYMEHVCSESSGLGGDTECNYWLDISKTKPIYKTTDVTDAKSDNYKYQGTIIPLKAGSTIYGTSVINNNQRTFHFIEYKLNSIAPQIAMPDYSATWVKLADYATVALRVAGSHTVTKNGFLHIHYGNAAQFTVFINEKQIHNCYNSTECQDCTSMFPVSKGDIISWSELKSNGNNVIIELYFIPAKTVSYKDESNNNENLSYKFSDYIVVTSEPDINDMLSGILYMVKTNATDGKYRISDIFYKDPTETEYHEPGNYTITLEEGTYQIIVIGSGSAGTIQYGAKNSWAYISGGSAPCLVCSFTLSQSQEFNLIVGSIGNHSIVSSDMVNIDCISGTTTSYGQSTTTSTPYTNCTYSGCTLVNGYDGYTIPYGQKGPANPANPDYKYGVGTNGANQEDLTIGKATGYIKIIRQLI